MTMAENIKYFFSNKLARIVLLSIEEVIGPKSMSSVLDLAGLKKLIENYPPDNLERGFSFDQISQIQEALERLYGPRGSKGLSLRAGRVAFKHGLREFGPLVGVTNLEFRLSPLDQKIRSGLDIFAEIFNRFTDQQVSIDAGQDYIFWHINRCSACWNRVSDVPICYFILGLLEETLYWVSGGKTFKIVETTCIAKGDETCSFQIEKQALG